MASRHDELAEVEDAEPILQATHGSPDRPLVIGALHIPCYVLEDGKRVLVQGAMISALGMSTGSATASASGSRLSKFVGTKSLQDYIPAGVAKAVNDPIPFRTPTGHLANGYEATILADICEAVLAARDDGKLHRQQEHIGYQCEVLVRGFARIGIIALVDEATGYQDVRARQALEEILAKFLSDELLPWAKRFPDEFYRELFRLRGLHYSEVSTKRPQYIGHLTNDIVYERLAPAVLEHLKANTPKDDKGRRRNRFHQWLTEDVGNPKLAEHLSNVITLMRASPNYGAFYRLLQRALPKYNDQLALSIDYRDELGDDIDMPS